MMICAIVMAFVLIAMSFFWNKHNEDAIVDLRNQLAYNQILPQVQEYAKLKDTRIFQRDGRNISIGSKYGGNEDYFSISSFPRKLEELKATLERNCPKKCAAKKKK